MAQNTIAWDRVEAATNRLIDLFASGELPTHIARTWIRTQQNDRPCASWSWGNQVLMMLADTEDARGYRQWEAVGRHVKKGARAFYILAPLTRKITKKDVDPDTGEEVERTFVQVYGFKAIPVFRVEDTEGAPITYPNYAPPTPPPLQAVAAAWGYTVTYGPGDGQCFGWTNAAIKRIHLMTEEPGTFWHELGHAADARHHDLKGGQQPDEEIVAETVAAVLALTHGQDLGRLGYTRAYIEGYAQAAKKSPTAAIMGLLERIRLALMEITTTAAALESAPATA